MHRDDTIIVIAYASYGPDEIADYLPRVVHVDAGNQILAIDHDVASLGPAPVA